VRAISAYEPACYFVDASRGCTIQRLTDCEPGTDPCSCGFPFARCGLARGGVV